MQPVTVPLESPPALDDWRTFNAARRVSEGFEALCHNAIGAELASLAPFNADNLVAEFEEIFSTGDSAAIRHTLVGRWGELRLPTSNPRPVSTAIASVRATREATVKRDGHDLPVIVGTPMDGEKVGSERFDGKRKTAVFPGDLPEDPQPFFRSLDEGASHLDLPDLDIVRFRPPLIEETGGGITLSVPHIRLDRAMQFLFGDRLA